MNVFLSHTHGDKDVVEQFAVPLSHALSREQVFYDSWSIQPGDGIIEKMNEGLSEANLVLFFVSHSSLKSRMVGLEWRNALALKGGADLKLIPVRLDDCAMPPILTETLYIDLYRIGVESAIRQVIDVIEGGNTFRASAKRFSNLHAYVFEVDGTAHIEIRAERFMEPISSFMIVSNGDKDDISLNFQSGTTSEHSYKSNIKLTDGRMLNGHTIKTDRATSPGFPFRMSISNPQRDDIDIAHIMHERTEGSYVEIPLTLSRPPSGADA